MGAGGQGDRMEWRKGEWMTWKQYERRTGWHGNRMKEEKGVGITERHGRWGQEDREFLCLRLHVRPTLNHLLQFFILNERTALRYVGHFRSCKGKAQDDDIN